MKTSFKLFWEKALVWFDFAISILNPLFQFKKGLKKTNGLSTLVLYCVPLLQKLAHIIISLKGKILS